MSIYGITQSASELMSPVLVRNTAAQSYIAMSAMVISDQFPVKMIQMIIFH